VPSKPEFGSGSAGGRYYSPARRVWSLVLSVVAFTVVTPLSVLVAAKLGSKPTHWSGATVADFTLPFDPFRFPSAPPESASQLLSASMDQDQGDTGDLGPSWYDAGAQEVVLGAVTPRGEEMRRALANGAGAKWRIQRVAHSARALQAAGNEVIELSDHGIVMTTIDGEHNRVVAATLRLSHALLTTIDHRYGDAVVLVYTPFQPPAYLNEPPPNPPSLWSRTNPPVAWWTLTTGFPWHLGLVALGVIALWTSPRLRRRPTSRQDPDPARRGDFRPYRGSKSPHLPNG